MGLKLPERSLSEIEDLPNDIQRFWGIWVAARAENGGKPPMRSAITMADLRSLAVNMLVVEREDEGPNKGNFILRMSGSGVDQMFGRNLTGEKFSVIAAPELAWMVDEYCNRIVSHPCGGFVRNVLTTHRGKKIRTDGLSLPITAADGEVRMMMCYNSVEGVGFSLDEPGQETRADTRNLEEACFIKLD